MRSIWEAWQPHIISSDFPLIRNKTIFRRKHSMATLHMSLPVAAVELHSLIFYTHFDTHVYCVFLYPFALISLMFQLPEGGARAVCLWLQSPRVLGFDTARWLARWLSGLCSGYLWPASGLALMGCCWVSYCKIIWESGCLSRAAPQHFASTPVKGGKGNETYLWIFHVIALFVYVSVIYCLAFTVHKNSTTK